MCHFVFQLILGPLNGQNIRGCRGLSPALKGNHIIRQQSVCQTNVNGDCIYLACTKPLQMKWFTEDSKALWGSDLEAWMTAAKELIGHWKKWKGRDLYLCAWVITLHPHPPSQTVCFCLAGWRFTELHFLCWKDSLWHKTEFRHRLNKQIIVSSIMSQIWKCSTMKVQWIVKEISVSSRYPEYKWMYLIVRLSMFRGARGLLCLL